MGVWGGREAVQHQPLQTTLAVPSSHKSKSVEEKKFLWPRAARAEAEAGENSEGEKRAGSETVERDEERRNRV